MIRNITSVRSMCKAPYMSDEERLKTYKDFRRSSGFCLYFESKMMNFYNNISCAAGECISNEVQNIVENYSIGEITSSYGMETFDSIYVEYWWSKERDVGFIIPCVGDTDLFDECIKVHHRQTLIKVNRLQLGFIILGTAINNCLSKLETGSTQHNELIQFKVRFVHLVSLISEILCIDNHLEMIS